MLEMSRRIGSLLGGTAALIALSCTTAANAAEPVVLAPVSPWNVDWSKTTCTLRRAFGSQEDPSIVTIERYGPTQSFHLSLLSSDFKSYEQGRTIQLKFGEQKARRIDSVSPGKSGADRKAILFFARQSLSEETRPKDPEWDAPVTPAAEAAIKTISISYYGREWIFATGPLDKPFAALRKCTDDLVRSWGLDPQQQATLSRPAKPLARPQNWIKSADYPQGLLTAGQQALVSFRLSINAAGAPTACEIQRSYNDKRFDDVSCALLMHRARFSPALDAQGQAVASYYLNTVRWIMRV